MYATLLATEVGSPPGTEGIAARRLVRTPTRESLRTLRDTRERFLSDPTSADLRDVRDIIARSWRRSAQCKVNPESSQYGQREVLLDQSFLELARPVLDRLEIVGANTGVCIVLSDANSTIASMRGDRDVIRWANRHLVSVGSHLPEELAGTNGGGTALEEGRSLQVWGAEHFAEDLQTSFCTSVPIRDALRGRTVAVLSLMVPQRVALEKDPRSFALIIESAAAEIAQALLNRSAGPELALLRAYLRESRLRGGDAVVAFDDRTVIVSATARHLLATGAQMPFEAVARDVAQDEDVIERAHRISADETIRFTARPVDLDGATIGTVMRLRDDTGQKRRERAMGDDATSMGSSLVGDSRVIMSVRKAARAALARPVTWILGERGVGRSYLAAQIAAKDPIVVDCARWADSPDGSDLAQSLAVALDSNRPVLCKSVDRLNTEGRSTFTHALGTRAPSAQLLLTAYEVIPDLLPGSMIDFEVRMPPLRSRLSDIPALVERFLSEDFPERELTATSKLLSALAQAHWPGNVSELRSVIRAAGTSATSDRICTDDLSESQRRSIARGRLSRLEAAELEQIRDAMVEANGRKTTAAEILEIGRSTLYRKMDRYAKMGYDFGQ